MINQTTEYLLLMYSITLKICNSLKGLIKDPISEGNPFYQTAKMLLFILVDSLTVNEETIRRCICIVFSCHFIFITSNNNEYNTIVI